MNWFNDLIRNFFGWIDSIIYGLVDGEYKTFINISQLTLLDNQAFDVFAQRVYTLIGIFMLFKLAFSLLEMLVSPDVLTDKNKGLGKIVQRVLISLILIVSTPFIFNYAFKIQNVVLGQNILANIILGGGYETAEVSEDDAQTTIQNTYSNGGKLMGFSVLNAFLSPKYTALAYPESEAQAAKDVLGEDLYNKAYVPYLEARKSTDINKLLDLKNVKNDGEYVFNYSFFVSTLAGAFVAWIMLTFCIDIGVRMVKLTFLQLIAPIPILSYIDPKTTKVFSSWTKECVKTYLDVFLRLLIIYFVIFILSIIMKDGLLNVYRYEWNITTGDLVTADYSPTFFETALVVIGLLMFAKQAPGLITDILGIKMSGDFTMNPLKKLSQSPYAAAALGGLGGAALGAAASIAGTRARRKDINKMSGLTDEQKKSLLRQSGYGRNLTRGIFGGAYRSGKTAASGKDIGKGITSGVTQTSSKRKLRETGYNGLDKSRDYFTDVAQIPNKSGTTSALKGKVKAATQRVQGAKAKEADIDRLKQSVAANKRKNLNVTEFLRATAYQDNVDDKGNISRSYNYDVEKYVSSGSQDVRDSIYSQYREDAANDGVTGAAALSKQEFAEQMAIANAERLANEETKAAEKALKEAKEQEELSKAKSGNKG